MQALEQATADDLACAAAQVPAGRELRETEVNDSLRAWLGTFCAGGSADHVTLRRSLVDPAITCGDGAKQGLETCDDGNTAGGDGCSARCRAEP